MYRILVLICVLAPVLGPNSPSFAKTLEWPIVFTQVPLQGQRSDLDAQLEDSRLVLLDRNGGLDVLSAGFTAAAEPDVSFDGTRILFSAKRHQTDKWAVYEMTLQDRQVRRVTDIDGNARKPIYQSTFYTIVSTEPWYQIAFVSDLANEINPSTGDPSVSLYSARLDGSEVRRLTHTPGFDTDPVLMEDGRLLFSLQQTSSTRFGPLGRAALFTSNTDGADLALFAADQGKRFKRMPTVTTKRMCVFVELDQPNWDWAGDLASVSLRRSFYSHRRIPTYGSPAAYLAPSPLPDGRVLVAGRKDSVTGGHGLYAIDPETGSSQLIYDDPGHHDIQAKVVTPRPEPDGRSSVVNDQHPTGQFYCLNLGISDLPELTWSSSMVSKLRVLEVVSARNRPGAEQTEHSPLFKRLLGEVPVESDGSVFFEVPANRPIQLQALDDKGLAMRTCSYIWVKNKEPRGCIGCHEDPELTPENQLVEAVTKPPRQLTLPSRLRRTVEFRRDVLPIVSTKCANTGCHPESSKTSFEREPEESREDYAARVYKVLMAPASNHSEIPAGLYVHPGRARTSPLTWHVTGRITAYPWDIADKKNQASLPLLPGGALSDVEQKVVVEWIDFGALFEAPRITESTDTKTASRGDQ